MIMVAETYCLHALKKKRIFRTLRDKESMGNNATRAYEATNTKIRQIPYFCTIWIAAAVPSSNFGRKLCSAWIPWWWLFLPSTTQMYAAKTAKNSNEGPCQFFSELLLPLLALTTSQAAASVSLLHCAVQISRSHMNSLGIPTNSKVPKSAVGNALCRN